MKQVLFIFVFLFSAAVSFAGINGSSGNSVGSLVTVEVCHPSSDGGCQMVTYEVRPPSEPTPYEEYCAFGETGGKCPEEYGLPQWLLNLSN